MTDAGGPVPVPAPRGSTLGLRLALAFLSVALTAVALLAGLTAALAAADVSALTNQQRADLPPVLDLATRTGAEAQIRDAAGQVVTTSANFAAQRAAPQQSALVLVGG